MDKAKELNEQKSKFEALCNEQAQKIRLKKVCVFLNDIHNNIEHPNNILNYIRTQIETKGYLVGGTGFIDYIKSNLVDNSGLNIYGRGNSLLDKDKVGNIFELLDTLKFDLSKTELNRIEKAPEASTNKQDTPQGNIELPDKLNTDKGKKLFQKLVDNGFCDEAYRWNKPKALLAYFADKASEYLGIGKGQMTNGTIKISWKPFESLFWVRDKSGKWAKVKGLSGARNDYQKTGALPCNSKAIDNLF